MEVVKRNTTFGFTEEKDGLFFEGFYTIPIDKNSRIVSMIVKNTVEPINILYQVTDSKYLDSENESIRVETTTVYRDAKHIETIFEVIDGVFNYFKEHEND